MKLTNRQMEHMLASLENVMGLNGPVGYAVAVNFHRLNEAAKPYLTMRNQFMEAHDFGEPDESGLVKVAVDSPEYREFMDGAGSIMDEECDVDISMVSSDDLPKELTARQVLSIYWMIEGV